MSNKFFISNNPLGFENSHFSQTDINTPAIAKLEIAIVTTYNSSTAIGLAKFNNSEVRFKNISTVNINIGDRVVLSYANNIDTMICLGVYETGTYLNGTV